MLMEKRRWLSFPHPHRVRVITVFVTVIWTLKKYAVIAKVLLILVKKLLFL